jgi:SAM-dependent methyltransferase
MKADWTESYFDETYCELFLEPVDAERTRRQVMAVVRFCRLMPKARILDVGCGIGRHSLLLAQLGFDVTGVDSNEEYIARCTASAVEQGLSAHFVTADCRSMELGIQADAALSLWSSFGYYGDEGDREVLRRMGMHVRHGGLVLVDVENRDYIVRHFVAEEWYERNGWTVMEKRHFSPVEGTVSTRRVLLRDGLRREYRRVLRMYSASEMTTLVQSAGLHVSAYYGDFDGSRFGIDSRRMIVLAQR